MMRSGTPREKVPEAVRVWLLGGFRVAVGTRTIEEDAWRLRKAAALVKLLALAPGHRLHREQTMDLLWPGLGKKAASNNLRHTLHAARRILHSTSGSRYLASGEEAHASLMRLYALSGQRQEAILQYERLRNSLSLELHIYNTPEGSPVFG
jgi:DNA-binding SARP family transcriptional activator